LERCLLCNEKISIARSLAGSRFCVDEHQAEYRTRMESNFLDRLSGTRVRLGRAPEPTVPDLSASTGAGKALPSGLQWDAPALVAATETEESPQQLVIQAAPHTQLTTPGTAAALRTKDLRSGFAAVAAEFLPVQPPQTTVEAEPVSFFKRTLRKDSSRPPLPAAKSADWQAGLQTPWKSPNLDPPSLGIFPESIILRLDLALGASGNCG